LRARGASVAGGRRGGGEPFLAELGKVVIDIMVDAYPHLAERPEAVLAAIEREETQFARTLDAGTSQLEGALTALAPNAERVIGRRPEAVPDGAPVLPGDLAFRLHD